MRLDNYNHHHNCYYCYYYNSNNYYYYYYYYYKRGLCSFKETPMEAREIESGKANRLVAGRFFALKKLKHIFFDCELLV